MGNRHRRDSNWWNSRSRHPAVRDSGPWLAADTESTAATVATVSSSNTTSRWNAGGGVMGYFSDHFGLRGDVRYLRNIQNNSTADNINFESGQTSNSGEPPRSARHSVRAPRGLGAGA
jgi:hypothetical protein